MDVWGTTLGLPHDLSVNGYRNNTEPDASEVKVITAQVEEKGVLATLAGLFKRQPHYSNSELLTQADQRVAGMSHAVTRQHYLAKLDYYRKDR